MKLSRERMTFDLRQRYRMTSELVEAVRIRKPLRILDAGSREGFLRHYLPEDVIINLDLEFFPGDSFLVGNLLHLPFASGAFDLSLSLDVLEHIEPGRRLDFLDEMARVSRDYFIIGAPFHDEKVAEAEKLANDFYLQATGRENQFLAEHFRFGLPALEEVTSWIARRDYRAVILPNNYLPFWLVMMGLSAYLSGIPRSGDLMATVTDLYERNLADYDYRSPSYRKIVLVAKSAPLDEAAIRRRLVPAHQPADLQDRAWDFAERTLSELNPHLERTIFELQEENSRLREEISRLREELALLRAGLEEEKARHRATRAELEGIKNTAAYRLFKQTWGRLRDALR